MSLQDSQFADIIPIVLEYLNWYRKYDLGVTCKSFYKIYNKLAKLQKSIDVQFNKNDMMNIVVVYYDSIEIKWDLTYLANQKINFKKILKDLDKKYTPDSYICGDYILGFLVYDKNCWNMHVSTHMTCIRGLSKYETFNEYMHDTPEYKELVKKLQTKNLTLVDSPSYMGGHQHAKLQFMGYYVDFVTWKNNMSIYCSLESRINQLISFANLLNTDYDLTVDNLMAHVSILEN